MTAQGETVWEYINPVDQGGPVVQGEALGGGGGPGGAAGNTAFHATRYAPDYPGLALKEASYEPRQ